MRDKSQRPREGRPVPRGGLVLAALALWLAATAEAGIKEKGALRRAPDPTPAVDRLADPGPALRTAIEARQAGQLERSKQILVGLSQRYPEIAGYTGLLLAQIALDNGKPEVAKQRVEATLQQDPSPLVESALFATLSSAETELGETNAALAASIQALRSPHAFSERANLELALARAFEREGNPEKAEHYYLRVWKRYPRSQAAVLANEALELRAAETGSDPRTATQQLVRAESLFNANRNERALEIADQVLAGPGKESAKLGALELRANILFRMRDYSAAIQAYEQLSQSQRTRIAIARARARNGDVGGGIDDLLAISKRAKPGKPQRALYIAALLLDDEEGRQEEAIALFERLQSPQNGPRIQGEATWRLGWAAYQDKRYADAVDHFERLAGYGGSEIAGLRAHYWKARAMEKAGEGPRARQEFFRLATQYPLSYYGWHSGRREQEINPVAPPTFAWESQEAALSSGLRERDVRRAQILASAGLETEATGEIARLSGQSQNLEDQLQVAELYREAGQLNAAQGFVIREHGEDLAHGPPLGSDGARLWQYAWPRAYADHVNRAAGRFSNVSPELVFAIMREESGFRPEVVSSSGARGLLQLMEPTAARLAQSEGRDGPFDPDTLFDPETNIGLGTRYLSELMEQFNGNLAPAIASYNAGPSAVQVWVEARAPGVTEDEWVEAIPYEQTRKYVKRVLRSIQAYQATN